MKFWTVSIAVLALAAAALAGGSNRSGVSMATLTSSKNVLMPKGSGRNRDACGARADHPHPCGSVPIEGNRVRSGGRG